MIRSSVTSSLGQPPLSTAAFLDYPAGILSSACRPARPAARPRWRRTNASGRPSRPIAGRAAEHDDNGSLERGSSGRGCPAARRHERRRLPALRPCRGRPNRRLLRGHRTVSRPCPGRTGGAHRKTPDRTAGSRRVDGGDHRRRRPPDRAGAHPLEPPRVLCLLRHLHLGAWHFRGDARGRVRHEGAALARRPGRAGT